MLYIFLFIILHLPPNLTKLSVGDELRCSALRRGYSAHRRGFSEAPPRLRRPSPPVRTFSAVGRPFELSHRSLAWVGVAWRGVA